MKTKAKSNLAVSAAITHFSRKGYFLFLPVGDNGGKVDLVVSPDGSEMLRVQCKYTSRIRTNCPTLTYGVDLRMFGRNGQSFYEVSDFDLLFVTTPQSNFVFPWKTLCASGKTPRHIVLGKRCESYRLK